MQAAPEGDLGGGGSVVAPQKQIVKLPLEDLKSFFRLIAQKITNPDKRKKIILYQGPYNPPEDEDPDKVLRIRKLNADEKKALEKVARNFMNLVRQKIKEDSLNHTLNEEELTIYETEVMDTCLKIMGCRTIAEINKESESGG